MQIFGLATARIKIHQIPTTRSGFIKVLHHCSVSWKITPLYFFSSNLILWTKTAHQSEIFRLLSGWVRTHQIPHVIFETTSQFFFNFASLSMSWEMSLLYFFSLNFIWFLQREPTKVQNFRLSTAQVKFHQICTLIGSFC